MPPLLQNGVFNIASLSASCYQISGALVSAKHAASGRSCVCRGNQLACHARTSCRRSDTAISLFLRSHAPCKKPTHRADVEAFRKGRILPDDLLPPLFAEKVISTLFRRGDHDIAVFQAFKEVEVSVRKAANTKGAGYSDSEVGTNLMRKAFHPDTGPLTDKSLVPAEREAEMHLFSGAIGHAKNPPQPSRLPNHSPRSRAPHHIC